MTGPAFPPRELVLICAGTGTVAALNFSAPDSATRRRAALLRAAVFLPSGQNYLFDAAAAGRDGASLELGVGPAGRGHTLRVMAQAAARPGSAQIAAGEPLPRPRQPLGLDVSLEPVSAPVPLGRDAAPGSATAWAGALTMSGTLAIGSLIYRLRGLGWSGWGPDAEAGVPSGTRVHAYFQDGSGLLVTSGAGAESTAGPAGPMAGPTAGPAAVRMSGGQVRAVPVLQLAVRASAGGPARGLLCTLGGRSPADMTGDIRDTGQHVEIIRRSGQEAGPGSWSYAPFVFVRSGVTGIGLVGHAPGARSQRSAVPAAAALPDPF